MAGYKFWAGQQRGDSLQPAVERLPALHHLAVHLASGPSSPSFPLGPPHHLASLAPVAYIPWRVVIFALHACVPTCLAIQLHTQVDISNLCYLPYLPVRLFGTVVYNCAIVHVLSILLNKILCKVLPAVSLLVLVPVCCG